MIEVNKQKNTKLLSKLGRNDPGPKQPRPKLGPNINWTSIVFIGNILSWLSFHTGSEAETTPGRNDPAPTIICESVQFHDL